MTAHTVTSYEEELKSLDTKILRMGGLAEQQLGAALDAIARADPDQARQAIASDAAIDAMQSEIEDLAVHIIARRQPVAVDLRNVVGAMRIAGDLERIGDMSKNIGKQIVRFDEQAWLAPMTKSLGLMGDMALIQLKNVLDAYSHRNAELARDVWMRDEEIDRQYNSIFRELLTYMMGDPRTISYGAHLLFCAKSVERIGDHCTNIAEAIAYIASGQSIQDRRPKNEEIA